MPQDKHVEILETAWSIYLELVPLNLSAAEVSRIRSAFYWAFEAAIALIQQGWEPAGLEQGLNDIQRKRILEPW